MRDWLPIEIVTPPVSSPLPIGLARAWCRLDADASADDLAVLTSLIQSAVDVAQDHTNLLFATQTVRMRRACFRPSMRFPVGPVQSITSITYLDEMSAEQTLAGSIYEAPLFGLWPKISRASGQSWPSIATTSAGIVVTAVVGFGTFNDVPPKIRLALQKMVATWFEQRMAGECPAEAMELLDYYRVPVIG